MSVIATKEFWSATAERAIKTFAQTLLGVWTASATTPLDIDWKNALLTAAFATVASVLTSLVSAGAGNPGPSLASEELVDDRTKQPVVGVVNPPPPPVV